MVFPKKINISQYQVKSILQKYSKCVNKIRMYFGKNILSFEESFALMDRGKGL
jgi:hypothetical protein